MTDLPLPGTRHYRHTALPLYHRIRNLAAIVDAQVCLTSRLPPREMRGRDWSPLPTVAGDAWQENEPERLGKVLKTPAQNPNAYS